MLAKTQRMLYNLYVYLENIVYYFFRQQWLVLRVQLMEINSNLFSRYLHLATLIRKTTLGVSLLIVSGDQNFTYRAIISTSGAIFFGVVYSMIFPG